MTLPRPAPTSPAASPPARTATPTGGRRHGAAVLACTSACTVLVVGFVASINLAVPELAASGLHPTSAQLLWIVDAYVVFFACLVIPAGALGDRYGRKGVLLTGLGVFGLGAAVSAVAPDTAVLLAGRVVTGIGAAAVLPNSLAVLVHATEPRRRPGAIAVWAAMSGVGGVVGNVGGGALLDGGSWRSLFTAVAPLAVACLLWAARVTPQTPGHRRPLNSRAAATLTAATLALLVGIIEGPGQGWHSTSVLAAFAAAVVLAGAWVLLELRAAHPLLDPRLLRIPALRAACLGMMVSFFGLFGLFFLNASLLQYGRGFSPLVTGLAIIPVTLPLLVAARRVPALVGRVGVPTVLCAAFAAIGGGLFGLATAISKPYWAYAGWLLLVGIGVALALPSLTMAIAGGLPEEQAGVAGGLQATTRELGSALGVAVIGTLAEAGFSTHLTATGGGHLGRGVGTVAQALLAQPRHRGTVVAAYLAGARSALEVMAIIVVAAGVVIVGESAWARRRPPAAT